MIGLSSTTRIAAVWVAPCAWGAGRTRGSGAGAGAVSLVRRAVGGATGVVPRPDAGAAGAARRDLRISQATSAPSASASTTPPTTISVIAQSTLQSIWTQRHLY